MQVQLLGVRQDERTVPGAGVSSSGRASPLVACAREPPSSSTLQVGGFLMPAEQKSFSVLCIVGSDVQ